MEYARRLRLTNLTGVGKLEELLHSAQKSGATYSEFLYAFLEREIREKENGKYLRRLKAAGLPQRHDLSLYDYSRTDGIDRRQMRELCELTWISRAYNLLLSGNPGTGKTFVAAGLVHEAVKAGYKAYLVTLEELLDCIRMKDVSRYAMKTYKRLIKADLLAVDDVTLYPLKGEDVLLLFKLVSSFYEKESLILTASQDITTWLGTSGDEAVTTALLDRLLCRCEIIRLSGRSYRMVNRETIFSSSDVGSDTQKELMNTNRTNQQSGKV